MTVPEFLTGVLRFVRGVRLHRLLKIIALLRGPKAWNARSLAEHLGTSRRNVYRDMAILELAGVPFYFDPDFGEHGAYRIRAEWWFPHVGVSDQECIDLAITASITEAGSIPALNEMSEVRDKLYGTLPARQQELMRGAGDLVEVLHLGLADDGPTRNAMVKVQQALLQKRQIDARYEGDTDRRVLQPRRLFLCHQTWYLAAGDSAAEETGIFRLSRLKEITVLDRACTVPDRFSLREFLGNAWEVGRDDRDWAVEIEFTGGAAERVAEHRWHRTQQIDRQDSGVVVFRATVSGLDEIKWWVLGFGPEARVRRPAELRDRVVRLLRQTIDTCTGPPKKEMR